MDYALTNLFLKELKVSSSSPVCVTSWTKASASSTGEKWHSTKQVFHREVDKNWRSPAERPSEVGDILPLQGLCIVDLDIAISVVSRFALNASVNGELVEDVFGRWTSSNCNMAENWFAIQKRLKFFFCVFYSDYVSHWQKILSTVEQNRNGFQCAISLGI